MFTEYREPREQELYEEISQLTKSKIEELYGKANRALRDTHAKSHVAVKAHLEIFDIDEDNIKQELAERTPLPASLIEKIQIKQGLFAKPARYPVWLRFANGRPDVNPDSKSDTRSMSVKIIGVEGDRLADSYQSNVQDIVTQNGDVFFISTIADYLGFLRDAFRSNLRSLIWLIFHLSQFLALRRITSFPPQSLLTEKYWSGSAYSLGLALKPDEKCPEAESVTYPAVIKYAFTPCQSEEPYLNRERQKLDIPKSSIPENYYREELIAQLAKPDAKFCWNFGIQFQATEAMSIDNIIIPWSEEESPFFTVGRLVVEHQAIDFENQYDFCENLTYSPWNGLQVHRPVGALNRLRRFLYPVIASYRLKKRGIDFVEMTGNENPNEST
ncbi:MAG: catalase [Planctomycetaceae bacterium]|nr:catalase [Planctomycetaceae bacterium]